jgi:hypothetical protein
MSSHPASEVPVLSTAGRGGVTTTTYRTTLGIYNRVTSLCKPMDCS